MTRAFPILVASLALGLAVSAPACSQNAQQRATVCPQGYQALTEAEPRAAIDAFRECLAAQEYDWTVEAELRLRLGSAYLAEGMGREALITYNQLMSLVADNGGDVDNPLIRRNRALAYLQLDRWQDGLDDLAIAARLDPSDGFTQVLIGSAHMELEQYAEAVAAFDSATRLEPDNPVGWTGRSAAFIELGLFDRGVDDAREAMSIDPTSADTLNALCWALVKDDRANEGMDICESAVEADPESGSIVHSLASALEQVGQVDEARELFGRAFELDPDNDTIAEDYARTREG